MHYGKKHGYCRRLHGKACRQSSGQPQIMVSSRWSENVFLDKAAIDSYESSLRRSAKVRTSGVAPRHCQAAPAGDRSECWLGACQPKVKALSHLRSCSKTESGLCWRLTIKSTRPLCKDVLMGLLDFLRRNRGTDSPPSRDGVPSASEQGDDRLAGAEISYLDSEALRFGPRNRPTMKFHLIIVKANLEGTCCLLSTAFWTAGIWKYQI